MKLSLGLAAALAGCAAAAQQAAEVYILPTTTTFDDSPAPLSVSRSLARLLLLQRLATAGEGPSTSEIPNDSDAEEVVSFINQYGKDSVSLFDNRVPVSPSQLVVMLEGLTDEQMKELGGSFGTRPAFTISNPPSASAHDKLYENDFYNIGVESGHKCSIKEVTNPFESKCWSGKSAVAKYNVQEDPTVLDDLSSIAPTLERLAAASEVETTILLFHAATATSSANQWSDKVQELRRRQSEEVVVSSLDSDIEGAPASPAEESPAEMTIMSSLKANAGECYASEDKCKSETGECSGHGDCVNTKGEGETACYKCKCLATRGEQGSYQEWVGPTCAKQDISAPFWLFVGFTLLLVGILAFSISLLFSVGEEKLPGVIGAGVSKSK